MFRKLILTGVMLTSTSLAYAGPRCVDCGPDTYGDISYVTPTHAAYVVGSIGQVLNYSGSPTIAKSYFGGLALGYGAIVAPRFYLAAEAFAKGYGNINDYSTSTTNLRVNWTYGASIIPGFNITNTVMAYFRAGILRTSFQRQGVARNGGQVGLGLQTNVMDNWDFRVEYAYSLYSSIPSVGRPQGDEVSAGIVYKIPM